MKSKIFLVGFMGSGKSTVGNLLAKLTGFEFIDMDSEIEREDDASIRDIFIKRGEHHFRNLESKLLDSLAKRENIIVSCGGGIIHDSLNVEVLKATESVVFLEADLSTLFKRVKEDQNRPFAFLDISDDLERFNKFKLLYANRKEAYSEASFVSINVDDKTPEQIAKFIYEHYVIR